VRSWARTSSATATFRTKGGKIDPMLGFERRWVIYNGIAEASCVPPSWHGWLHHTVDELPSAEQVTPRSWWKPHRPNLTGTPGAHRPTGSTLAQGRRPKATGDYKLGDRNAEAIVSATFAVPVSRHALPPPHSAC